MKRKSADTPGGRLLASLSDLTGLRDTLDSVRNGISNRLPEVEILQPTWEVSEEVMSLLENMAIASRQLSSAKYNLEKILEKHGLRRDQ